MINKFVVEDRRLAGRRKYEVVRRIAGRPVLCAGREYSQIRDAETMAHFLNSEFGERIIAAFDAAAPPSP